MPIIKTQGIVLKQINVGEADKIITLFTDKLGKIQVVAHGARKSKSRYMSSTQVFAYCEYVLYKGKSLYTISQSEIKESFQSLLDDLYTITYCSYMIELVDVLTQSEERDIELFKLLLKALYLMTDRNGDREFIVRVFELKAMTMSGYMPNLHNCSVCGMEDKGLTMFNTRYGGVVCTECGLNDKYNIRIDSSTLNVMKHLIRMDIEKIHTIKISAIVRNEMKKILKNYIKYYLEREFKSLEFLEDIKYVDEKHK